jgi:hypothetical protein
MTDAKEPIHKPEQGAESHKAGVDKSVAGVPITKPEDNAIQQRSKQREALQAYRFTRDKHNQFTIEDSGHIHRDQRGMEVHGRVLTPSEANRTSPDSKIDSAPAEVHKPTKTIDPALEKATENCLTEARTKWGAANLHDIRIDKGDLNAALTLAVLGPGVYKMLGHDRAEAFGQSIVHGCAPILQSLTKTFNPPLPDAIAQTKSNPADDKTFQAASKKFFDGCVQTYGAERIKALGIDEKDFGASFGLYLMGPELYKAVGHDAAQSMGKKAFLFGFAPLYGAAEEGKRALNDLSGLTTEAAMSGIVGAGAGIITKLVPETSLPLLAAAGGAMVKDQLDPKTIAQNRDALAVANHSDSMTNSQLLEAARSNAKIAGPKLFHTGVSLIAGTAGFGAGETAVVPAAADSSLMGANSLRAHEVVAKSGDSNFDMVAAKLQEAKSEPRIISDVAPLTVPAQKQSVWFSAHGGIDQPLVDGMTFTGKGRYINSEGEFSAPWAATVVDKAHDSVLRETLAEAQNYLKPYRDLSMQERETQLTNFVRAKFNSHGHSPSETDALYMRLITAHPGQRLNLGDFISQGMGGCTQQSALLKVLGDELIPQAKFKIVAGNGTDGGAHINHMWVQSGDRIFDPRRGVNGDLYADNRSTYRAASDMSQSARFGVTSVPELTVGSKVYGADTGWTVKHIAVDGHVTIAHDGAMSMPISELAKLNPSLRLKIGERVSVSRVDSTANSGWSVSGLDAKTGDILLHKPDAIEQTLSKEQLGRHIPEMVAKGKDQYPETFAALAGSIHEVAMWAGQGRMQAELGIKSSEAMQLRAIAIDLQTSLKSKSAKTAADTAAIADDLSDTVSRIRAGGVSVKDEISRLLKVVAKEEPPRKPVAREKEYFYDSTQIVIHTPSPSEPSTDRMTVRQMLINNESKIDSAFRKQAEAPIDAKIASQPAMSAERAQALKALQDRRENGFNNDGDIHRYLVEKLEIPNIFAAHEPRDISSLLRAAGISRDEGYVGILPHGEKPRPSQLFAIADALEQSNIKILGGNVHYTERSLLINFPKNSSFDGRPLSDGGTLKVDLSPSQVRNSWDPKLLTPVTRMTLSNGETANIYVQEALKPIDGDLLNEKIDDLAGEIIGHDLRVPKNANHLFGVNAAGDLRVIDSASLLTPAETDLRAVLMLAKENEPQRLAQLLIDNGEIPKTVPNIDEARPLSSWLKEALARPKQFRDQAPGLLETDMKARLWDLSQSVESMNINVKGSDIWAGGESIVALLKQGTSIFGQPLAEDAVLKFTWRNPLSDRITEKIGTRDWEAKIISPMRRLELASGSNPLCYLQELCDPIKAGGGANMLSIMNVIARMKKDGFEFPDALGHEIAQFGIRRSDGQPVLMDLTAPSANNFMRQEGDKGSQY